MFNWDAMGAIGEIVGALAVVLTLAYLAKQIKQSVKTSHASTNRSLQVAYEGINDLIVTNPRVNEVLKSIENPARGQDRPDSVLLRHLTYRWFNVWQSAQVAFYHGQLSREEFDLYVQDFNNISNLYPTVIDVLVEELADYPGVQTYEIFEPIRERINTS